MATTSPSLTLNLASIENAINEGENIAAAIAAELGPMLSLVPGFSQYVPVVTAVIKVLPAATQAIEQAIGAVIGSVENTQAVVSAVNPAVPTPPAVASALSPAS